MPDDEVLSDLELLLRELNYGPRADIDPEDIERVLNVLKTKHPEQYQILAAEARRLSINVTAVVATILTFLPARRHVSLSWIVWKIAHEGSLLPVIRSN